MVRLVTLYIVFLCSVLPSASPKSSSNRRLLRQDDGEQATHSEVFDSILNNTNYDKRERPKSQDQIQVKTR